MFKSALSFWISLAGFVLAGLGLLGARTMKRRKLGKVLWAPPPPAQRWIAILGLLMAGLGSVGVATGSAARPMILYVGCSLYSALLLAFGPNLVSVHESGICIGLLCLSWREVAGWSWEPGAAPEAMLSLNIQSRDHGQGRGLCVWSTSRWRWFYSLRPQRPIRTRVGDGDLEALLHKYAPQAERPSMARV
jgi:hypothetical protein